MLKFITPSIMIQKEKTLFQIKDEDGVALFHSQTGRTKVYHRRKGRPEAEFEGGARGAVAPQYRVSTRKYQRKNQELSTFWQNSGVRPPPNNFGQLRLWG